MMPGNYNVLRAELAKPAYSGLTDEQAAAMVLTNNPRPPLPKPFTLADVLGPLSGPSVAKLMGRPTVGKVLDAVVANDRSTIGVFLSVALAQADITQDEHDAVMAVVGATQPDSSGLPNLPGWDLPVTAADVHAVRS